MRNLSRRIATFAVLCGAVVFVFSIASPALGGPSIGQIATKAKKALSTAKKAKRSARSANNRALDALDAAGTAQSAANSALAQRVGVTVVDGPAGSQCADGGGGCQVASSNANCPTGTVVVGGGFRTSTPDNVVSYSKRVGNGWGVIASNFWSTSATLEAHAVCASGPVTTASTARASAGEFARALVELRDELER